MKRVVGGIAASLFVCALGSSPASAAGCYGDWCSGKDPTATGCANDAITVASTDAGVGRLDLRWSPSCKTNWGRFYLYPTRSDGGGYVYAIQPSTGYKTNNGGWQAGTWSSLTSQTTWSPMIYSPTRCVKAVVGRYPGWRWNTVETACL